MHATPRIHTSSHTTQAGFTLIEILVSIAILGLLVAVLASSLTGTMKLNRDSQQEIAASTSAQQVMETVRGAWNTLANYDTVCVPGYTVPTGYTVSFANLGSRAELLTGTGSSGSPVYTTTGCTAVNPSGGTPPAMRRITVTYQVGGKTNTISLDVLRPQP